MRTSLTRTVTLAGVLALVAACGGGDGDEDAARDERRATTTTTTAADGATTTSAAGPAPDGDAGGAASAGSGGGAGGATATTAAPAAGAAGGGGGGQAASPATPGTYHYRMTGSAKFGPTAQNVDETVSLVVDPAQGNRQRSVRRSSQGTTTSVLEYRPDGVFLAELVIEQAGMRFRFAPNPPVPALPAPASMGQTWAFDMTSDDGCQATHTDGRVGAVDENVDVGGTPVATIRIELATSIKPTGKPNCPALTADQTSTLWASPEARVVAREQTATKGTLGSLAFTSDLTSVLRSTTPS